MTPEERARAEQRLRELEAKYDTGTSAPVTQPKSPSQTAMDDAEATERLRELEAKYGTGTSAPVSQPQEYQQRPGDDGIIGGMISSAAQGVTLGTADRLESMGRAAFASAFGDETFEKAFERIYREEKRQTEKFRQEHPYLAIGSEVAGAVAPAVLAGIGSFGTGTAAVGGATAARLAPTLARVGAAAAKRPALSTAAGSGFYSMMDSPAELGSTDSVTDAIQGAALGLATFGVLKGARNTLVNKKAAKDFIKTHGDRITPQKLTEEAQKRFAVVDAAPFNLTPASTKRLMDRIQHEVFHTGKAPQKGGAASANARLYEFLRNMEHTVGRTPTVKDLDDLYKQAWHALSSAPDTRFRPGIRRIIDEHIDTLTPRDVTPIMLPGTRTTLNSMITKQVLRAAKEGRHLWNIKHKVEALDEVLRDIKLADMLTTGKGDAKLVQEIQAVLKRNGKDYYFTDDEIELIAKQMAGPRMRRILRGLGTFSPGTARGAIAMGVGGLGGFASHPLLGMLLGAGIPAAGIGARTAAKAGARGGLDTARTMIGARQPGQPLPQLPNTKLMGEQLIPGISRYMGSTMQD